MNRITAHLAATLLACLLSTVSQAALTPAEAYGNLEAVSDVTINPGGTYLAWAANDGKETQVVVFEIASRKTLRTFKVETGFKVRDIDWANDNTLLFAISSTLTSTRRRWPGRFEYMQWLAADVATGRSQLLMTEGNKRVLGGSQLVRRRIAHDPHLLVMASADFEAQSQGTEIGTRLGGKRRDSGYVYSAFSMDVSTGKSKLLESGTPFTRQWLADSRGQPVVRSEWNPELQRYSVLAKDGAGWRRILEVKGDDDSYLAGLDAGDATVLVFTRNGEPRANLWSFPLDGSAAKKLIDEPDRTAEGLLWDPFDRSIEAVRLGGADRPYHWIDPVAQKRYAALGRSFPGRYVDIESRSADNQRVIVEVGGAAAPTMYYLVDFAAKSADIVGEEYPGLADKPVGTVRRYDYAARDQYALFGYLTLPPGAAEKQLPLVVLPHGGPESHDTTNFDWFSQFFAARGYAVLRPQFRGSTGLGEAHRLAGRGQWGRRMQDDVSDGVKALVAQGIADPKRVCIVGDSYGGYAALAGAALTPDLYACAVSINGISDLPEFLAWREKMTGDESNSFFFWRDSIGDSLDSRIAEVSPASVARNVRAPILLIHGTNDSVVPIAQSELMANALKSAGKTYEFIRLESEDHWLSSSATRVRLLGAIDKFLAPHLDVPAK
ncbi:MAG: acylamino-acid-releasing enzyme [Burkholderiales bacterium]|nr:acylamino-acid-releasing enzyme [Burkholderiales bacterium]